MNYIMQINTFYRILPNNSLSSNAQCLYWYLLHKNNELGWIKEFSVANSIVSGYTELDISTLQRARNELIQKKYIKYKKGKGNKAGSYSICRLYDLESEQQGEQQPEQQGEQQSDSNVHTLNKLNKTKLNKDNNIYITSATREGVKQITKYVYLKEEEIKRLRLDFDDEVVKRAIQILDNYKANNPRKTSGKEAYKDDNRAIRAWTIDKAQENIAKEKINNNRVKMSEKELAIVEKKEKYYSSKKEKNKVTVKNQHDEREYANINKLYD